MTITPPTFHDAPELSASRGLATQEIVQALYRLLMLREPDPWGFDTWTNAIGNGMRIEDALHAFLTSKEFVTNRMQFCREYFPAARSKILRFEFVVHYCDGRAVIFALDKGANDLTLKRCAEHFLSSTLSHSSFGEQDKLERVSRLPISARTLERSPCPWQRMAYAYSQLRLSRRTL